MKMPVRLLAARALALSLVSFLGAPAFAANVYVRNARVTDAETLRRDEVTDRVRAAVARAPGQRLVFDARQADAVLQPVLRGKRGAYVLRVDRVENGISIAAAERAFGDWRQVSASASHATSALLQEYRQTQIAAAAARERGNLTYATVDGNDDRGTVSAATTATPEEDLVAPSTTGQGAGQEAGQSRREFHPIRALRDAPSFWTVGVGPGFGVGVGSGNMLYSLAGGYVWDLNSQFALKALGQADLGSGGDNAQFLAASIGGDAYFAPNLVNGGRPYVTADLGLGNARNQARHDVTGLALGAGAGFRYATSEATNLDLLLRYKLIADNLDGATPSVFSVQAALNF